jgi:gamma-glutamyltranspeptidase / glutathione hydrolase
MKTGLCFCRAIAVLIIPIVIQLPIHADSAHGQKAVVASGHPIATQAGMDAFRRGGNAIDAAIAIGLTLGVVDGSNSGIGGGCVMTVRLANGKTVAIDGREFAPSAATRDMYVRNGQVQPQLSRFGALSPAVPGALMAYGYVSTAFGRLPFSSHMQAAAAIAEAGFVIDTNYAQRLASAANELKVFPSTRAIFLTPDGKPKQVGELLRQPELALTYRSIATQGSAWFYNGPFALATGMWMATNGGIMLPADFALYQVKVREPVTVNYRGYTIVGFPPPSSGGVHVAQILNILEKFDLKKMGRNSADAVHVIAEAMKLAFADRAYWLGDPDFVGVPRGLFSKQYAAGLAARIKMDQVLLVAQHGTPSRASQDTFQQRHTTHFSTADAAGNWVACTATINTSFGSKVVIPGTGVLMNNEMDDFSIQPGVPNYFGLVGGEANSVAPRKRPLTSMSPTILMKGGRPIMAVGAAGGPTIISQTVLAIINVVDFGQDPEAALAEPRFHHQWNPNELRIERSIGDSVLQQLEKRGHKLTIVDALPATQAVGIVPNQPGLIGVTDPRATGKAGAF